MAASSEISTPKASTKQEADVVSPVRGAISIIDLSRFTSSDILVAVAAYAKEESKPLVQQQQQQDDHVASSSLSQGAVMFLQETMNNIALQFQLVAASGLHVRSGVPPIAIGAILPIPTNNANTTTRHVVGSKRPRDENENEDQNAGEVVHNNTTPASVTWLYHVSDTIDSFGSSTTNSTSTTTPSSTHWSRGSGWEEVSRRVLSQLVASVEISTPTMAITTTRGGGNTSMATYLNALLSCVAVTSKCFSRSPRVIHHHPTTKKGTHSDSIQHDDVDDAPVATLAASSTNATSSSSIDDLPPVIVLMLIPPSSLETTTDTAHPPPAMAVLGHSSDNDDKALSQVARLMLQLNMRLMFSSSGGVDEATTPTTQRLCSLALLTRGFWGPSSPASSSQLSISQVLGFAISMATTQKSEEVTQSSSNYCKQMEQVVRVLLMGSAIKGGALLGSLLCAFPLHPTHVFHADDRGTTYIDTRKMSILDPEVVAAASVISEERRAKLMMMKDEATTTISSPGTGQSSSSSVVKSERRNDEVGGGGITIPRQRTAPLATGNGRGGGGGGVNPKIDTSVTKKEGGTS